RQGAFCSRNGTNYGEKKERSMAEKDFHISEKYNFRHALKPQLKNISVRTTFTLFNSASAILIATVAFAFRSRTSIYSDNISLPVYIYHLRVHQKGDDISIFLK
ncbi:MAG: hypothetical protein ACR2K1_01215, partial [Saprospiraceae bacterium]